MRRKIRMLKYNSQEIVFAINPGRFLSKKTIFQHSDRIHAQTVLDMQPSLVPGSAVIHLHHLGGGAAFFDSDLDTATADL